MAVENGKGIMSRKGNVAYGAKMEQNTDLLGSNMQTIQLLPISGELIYNIANQTNSEYHIRFFNI